MISPLGGMLCSARCSIASEPQERKTEKIPDENLKVDWALLWFSDVRKIEKISITLSDMKSSPWHKTGIAGKHGMRIETRDPIIIKTIQQGMMLPLRRGIPDKAGWGAGGTPYPVGFIEVTTNKDSFVIGVTWSGFSLGSKEFRMQNVFYSWMLAKQLDDILFRETKLRIPSEVFKSLSGEHLIEAGKMNYKAIRDDSTKKSCNNAAPSKETRTHKPHPKRRTMSAPRVDMAAESISRRN